jgi:hypothetical protein
MEIALSMHSLVHVASQALAQASDALPAATQAATTPLLAAQANASPSAWEVALSVVAGLGIAAACGFRVFVPLLVLAVASKAGLVGLGNNFAFLSTWPAIIALGVACTAEISAFHIPWLDHALDTLAAPAAVVAGGVAMLTQVGAISSPMDPWMQWLLGALAGGAAAGVVQAGTMLMRGLSTLTTGGFANPVVASIETGLALLISVLAIVVPVIAIIAVALAVFLAVRMGRRWKAKRARAAAARAPQPA